DWSINPEITEEYKKIIGLRKESEATKDGNIQPHNNQQDVVACKKTSGTAEVGVLVNVRKQSVNYEVDQSLLQQSLQDAFDQTDYVLHSTVDLAPYAYVVLKNK